MTNKRSYVFNEKSLTEGTRRFYLDVLKVLTRSNMPFLAGGAYALGCYTGITRDTKDFDVFVIPGDTEGVLRVLSEAGYRTELTDKNWLAKAFSGESLVDIIFGFANGTERVDEEWFEHSRKAKFMKFGVNIVPPEEMIFSKAFLMTRDRFDGADICHIILCQAESMDWKRFLRRFEKHWRLLYNHLILFGYVYPGSRGLVPGWVMDELSARLSGEAAKDSAKGKNICMGTFLSSVDYIPDMKKWGYLDGRKI